MNIYLRPSRILFGYLLATHAVAIALVMLSKLHWLLTPGLLLLISLNLLRHARRLAWLRGSPAVTVLKLSADQRWQLIDSQGHLEGEYKLKGSVMLGVVLVIYLKKPFGRLSLPLLIARDAVTTEQWRLLRVRLRDPEHWG